MDNYREWSDRWYKEQAEKYSDAMRQKPRIRVYHGPNGLEFIAMNDAAKYSLFAQKMANSTLWTPSS